MKNEIYCQSGIRKYPDLECNCTSKYLNESEHLIVGKEINRLPNYMILHYGVKYSNINEMRHGTVSFISSDLLITANHLVFYEDSIQFIEIALPSAKKDKWVRFAKGDFLIYSYKENFRFETDIAIIKLINSDKLRSLYKSHFEIGDTSLINSKSLEVHLTGFPCSKFSVLKENPDTLMERVTNSNQLKINQSNTLLGHDMYSCFGDSGAPIWVEKGGKYYLIGVNEGFNNRNSEFKQDEIKMIAVLINGEITQWVNSIMKY